MNHRTTVALGVLAVTLLAAYGGQPVQAKGPDSAPALPAPTGSVVNVSTVAALQAAVSSLASNRTIVIAPGTYNLTSTLWINGTYSNVTIRGATNNRNDVVLVGKGMGVSSSTVPFGIWTGGNVNGITIANLTIRDIYQHPIMLNAGTESPRIYNVRLLDAGEQFIKANPDGSGGGVDNGIVEYSVIEYTNAAPTDYTNGVDVHSGRNWIVRHNLFRRIRSNSGLAGPAILMWNGSSGSIADGNTFIDCHREISFGLINRTPNDHTGGVIRNNFIVRNSGMGGDVGIAVFDSPSTKVVHNTIRMNNQYPNAIETRFSNTTGVQIVNNLADRGVQIRDGSSASQSGNVWTAAASWFTNPAAGDLHLTASAAGAIDAGVSNADAPTDWDGTTRFAGNGPDVGADERSGATAPGDTTAPSLSIATPAQSSVVSGTITIRANASDNVGVASVWFTVDGNTSGGEDSAAPYQVSWNTRSVANGVHQLRAAGRDAAGNASMSAPVSVTVNNSVATPPPSTPPPSTPPPSSGGCTSPRPGANWTCHNGGWLPPGMPPPAPPSTPPPTTPPPSTPPPPSSTCTSPRPGANWTCYNGGWLPPGMTPPAAAPSPPPPSTAPPSTPPPTSAACTSVRPGANWTCYNGGWLPPGMTPPASAPPSVAPPPPQTGCTTVRPGPTWTCRNGGWLPPGM